MEKIFRKFFIFCLCLFIFFFGILEAKADEKPYILIPPLFIKKDGICPICGTVFRRGEILPGAKKTFTRILYQKIEAKGIFKIYPLERVSEILSHKDQKQLEVRPREFFIELGRELGSDYILVGYIFRFEERMGSSLGVERPASLSFDLHLFRIKDAKEVWKGRMDETQRPLSENILKIGSFLRRGAKWLTVEELASVGLEEVLKDFPEAKELEEER